MVRVTSTQLRASRVTHGHSACCGAFRRRGQNPVWCTAEKESVPKPSRRAVCSWAAEKSLAGSGGGLASVYMSWSAAEYLYMLLLLNRTLLPPQALFIVRYQKVGAIRSLAGSCRPLHSGTHRLEQHAS